MSSDRFLSMKKFITIIVFISLCVLHSVAQDFGYLEGTVKAGDTGETLIGAHIKAKGDLSTGAITDIAGNYSIQLSEGHYIFVVSFGSVDIPDIY